MCSPGICRQLAIDYADKSPLILGVSDYKTIPPPVSRKECSAVLRTYGICLQDHHVIAAAKISTQNKEEPQFRLDSSILGLYT